jgi:hypothetical protein
VSVCVWRGGVVLYRYEYNNCTSTNKDQRRLLSSIISLMVHLVVSTGRDWYSTLFTYPELGKIPFERENRISEYRINCCAIRSNQISFMFLLNDVRCPKWGAIDKLA